MEQFLLNRGFTQRYPGSWRKYGFLGNAQIRITVTHHAIGVYHIHWRVSGRGDYDWLVAAHGSECVYSEREVMECLE